MPEVREAGSLFLSVPVAIAFLALGIWSLAVLDIIVGAVAARRRLHSRIVVKPFRDALRLLLKERRATDVPDDPLWLLAPLMLLTITALTSVVVPLAPGLIGADLNVGIVYFSGFLILTVVAVFFAGWGPNSKYPMIAGFRFIGMMLAYGSAFAITIISVALPAESLAIGDIVAFQGRGLWNIVLQPIGFLLYVVLGMAITFWGPQNVVAGDDLGGGIYAEMSGAPGLVWRIARYGVLLMVSAFGTALFLGGWHGPGLAPALWTILKTLVMATIFVVARWWLPIVRTEGFMKLGWIVLLPLSFVNVFGVGLILLLFPSLGKDG